MRLLEPRRTAAVIFGAQDWPRIPRLNGGEAFARSAADMKAYIQSEAGLGLSESDVLNLFDSDKSAGDQLVQLSDFLHDWIDRAGGDPALLTGLFVYYVGHGDFIGSSNEFFMLVRQSRYGNQLTYLIARALADCLREEAPFIRQVVVLDCCFSGAAQRVWMSGGASKVAATETAELMPSNGTVLLCSSSEDLPSMAPKGSKRTMFTDAFLEALTAGSSAIQGDITPRQARDLAYAAMKAKWKNTAVRPVIHAVDRGAGDLSDIALFPNPAVYSSAPAVTGEDDDRGGEARPDWMPAWLTRRRMLAGAGVTGVTLAGAVAIEVKSLLRQREEEAARQQQLLSELQLREAEIEKEHQANKYFAGTGGDPSQATRDAYFANVAAPTALEEEIGWFKDQFQGTLTRLLAATPLTPNLLTALALAETVQVWGGNFPPRQRVEVLSMCAGDTLDAPFRNAFPRSKAELLSVPNGGKMFAIARKALEDLAVVNPAYQKIAAHSPDKFMHSFGIYPYDLEFFRKDMDFFLNRQWRDFDRCASIAIKFLIGRARRLFGSKTQLTDDELVYVAISYNTGSVNLSKGFKQGFRGPDGRYYGEIIADYLKAAKKIP